MLFETKTLTETAIFSSVSCCQCNSYARTPAKAAEVPGELKASGALHERASLWLSSRLCDTNGQILAPCTLPAKEYHLCNSLYLILLPPVLED